jgi:hypothetical protein
VIQRPDAPEPMNLCLLPARCKYGASRFIRICPQLCSVRISDQAAEREHSLFIGSRAPVTVRGVRLIPQ